MDADEKRLEVRCELESAIREYYEACNVGSYDFEDDIKHIIYDATDGEVSLS